MKAYRVLSTFAVMSFGAFALATGPAVAAAQAAPADQTTNTQISNIDAEIRRIEGALPNLTRNEVMLKPGALADVTTVPWTKLHAYSRDGKVVRVKLYPPEGATKTEEFYYRDGALVLVFEEPNGAGHMGHNPDATGTRYYFKAGSLFAVKAQNQTTTSLNEQQEAMGTKLLAESKAVLRLGSANDG